MKEYDIFELKKDLNPMLPKGSTGVILIKYPEDEFEVEFVKKDGTNIEFEGRSTFTISKAFIQVIWKDN
jgi:hypothetical protein